MRGRSCFSTASLFIICELPCYNRKDKEVVFLLCFRRSFELENSHSLRVAATQGLKCLVYPAI